MLDLLSREQVSQQTLRFDYTKIEARHRETVIEAAIDIQGHATKAVEGLIAIGERLSQIKGLLPHGQFQEWVEQEFGIERRMAQNYMAVASRFGYNKQFADKSGVISFFSPTAMYLLAAPSTPLPAVEAAISEIEGTGQRLKVKRIKEIVAEYTVAESVDREQPADDVPVTRPSKANVARLQDALIGSQQALEQARTAAQTVPGYHFSIQKCLDLVNEALEQLRQEQQTDQ
ncbi:MAG TPA: DUF3102 domain-containing protein [Caldilineaceae bacterium]|nr:DUF3102 domain-containing protein [Caldilineaceae bacterium]